LFLSVKGAFFFGSTSFDIFNSSFTNCSANNGNGGGTGGAIYTQSTAAGLRYLVDLNFSQNTAGRFFMCGCYVFILVSFILI
jgi:hypothetical protein